MIRYYLAKGQSLETMCNLTEIEKHILWNMMCKDIKEEREKIKAMSGR